MDKTLTDEQITEAIKAKLKYHRDEMTKHKCQVDKYSAIVEQLCQQDESRPIKKKVTVINNDINDHLPFKDAVLLALSDGIPKTTRELLDLYLKIPGKTIAMTDFSSRLISMRKSTLISTHTFPNNPILTRSYHGKPEWFNGDQLKNEYLKKIK